MLLFVAYRCASKPIHLGCVLDATFMKRSILGNAELLHSNGQKRQARTGVWWAARKNGAWWNQRSLGAPGFSSDFISNTSDFQDFHNINTVVIPLNAPKKMVSRPWQKCQVQLYFSTSGKEPKASVEPVEHGVVQTGGIDVKQWEERLQLWPFTSYKYCITH